MKEFKCNICRSSKLITVPLLILRFSAFSLLIIISNTIEAQSIQKIEFSDHSIQKLSEWRIIGPFNSPFKNTKQLDSLKVLTQRKGRVLKNTFYLQNEGKINLDSLLSTRKKAIAYGSCEVLSEQNQEIILFIKVDDKIKIWVNSEPPILVQKHTTNGAVVKKSMLKKGVNRIFIEIENNSRDWWFDLGILGHKRSMELLSSMKRNSPTNIINSNYGPRTQLTNWRVIGPFKNTIEDLHDFDMLKINPSTNGQNIVDTIYHQGRPGNSLHALFKTSESNRVAYAVCNLFSDKDQEIVLDLRVDDELRLWINNREILRSPADRIAIKKVQLKKGNNEVIAEVRNEYLDWWFEIAVSGLDYVRDNMLLPSYGLSSLNPVIARGDSLMIAVADTNFIPIRKIPKIDIFDAANKSVYSGEIDVINREKLPLLKLPSGAYRYKLYTDLDTLSEYFCYGSLDAIYNSNKLLGFSKSNPTVYKHLLPYIGRFDRLISDYKKGPSILLGKKLAHCIFKIKEIETAVEKRNATFLNAEGIQLRTFTSVIDNGDEHYMLYVPERVAGSGNAIPLVVMVPFITNNHPFYTGTIIANYERITYISRFADRYGFAVLFPSSRIFKWYNQTPITTKSIIESIQDVRQYYNIDKDRVFLYGECSGALFALQAAVRRPDVFASIAIRGPELSTVNLKEAENSAKLSNNIFALTENFYSKPILVLHSNLDHAARIEFTNELVDSVKKNGGVVYYNSLEGLIKDYDMTSYSEQEVINATFSFFSNLNRPKPAELTKIATYGFYNDTVNGFFVKEKLALGKATIAYQITQNKLELTTENIGVLNIDRERLPFNDPEKIEVYHNGKRSLRNIDYVVNKNFIELNCTSNKDLHNKNVAREVCGPINRVFLNTFAIVRPSKLTEKKNLLIAAIDSIWFTEYRNHILIIDENRVDSAKKARMNLVYIVDSMHQVPKELLLSAGIELYTTSIMIDSENFKNSEFSFSFYQKDDNNRDNLFLGAGYDSIPFNMLKNLFTRAGWSDFELWNGDVPFFQKSYQ